MVNIALCEAHEASSRVPDQTLIAQCLQGDMEAFGQIYTRYEQSIYRYAFYLMGDEDDASDAKQETFVRAYRSLRTFRGDASLQTWLLRICTNHCRDGLRSRSRRGLPLDDVLAQGHPATPCVPGTDPHETAERAEVVDTILQALHGLPPPLREVIILHEVEGMETREVARAVGCSVPAARTRIHRARQCLKTRVRSMLGGD